MTGHSDRKDYPISMRMPEADLAVIDRAAGLKGRSRTQFVRDAAVRAAEDVLLEDRAVSMGAAGFAEFQAILAAPATVVPAMVEIIRRPAPWEAATGEKS